MAQNEGEPKFMDARFVAQSNMNQMRAKQRKKVCLIDDCTHMQ